MLLSIMTVKYNDFQTQWKSNIKVLRRNDTQHDKTQHNDAGA